MSDILSSEPIPSPLDTVTEVSTPSSGATSGKCLTMLLSLFAVYIIWGSTYLAIKIAIGSFPPFFMAGMRFIIAGSILFLLLRLRGAAMPSRSEWLGAGAVGALLLVGGMGGVAFAEQWVPSGLTALCIAVQPILISLFAGLWGRWPTGKEWVGMVVGFAGVVLLNLGSNLWANPLGAIVLMISPLCWAFGSAWSRHLPMPSGLMASAVEMLVGGVLLMLVGFGTGEHMTALPTTASLLAFSYLIVFGSLIAFSAYGYLLRTMRPALATSYAYVNPVIAVALGVALAGEQITLPGLIAMLVILLGVGLVSLGRTRATA